MNPSIMNERRPNASAPVTLTPKSNVTAEPREQFYERAKLRRIRSYPDVSAAGHLTVELAQYLKGTAAPRPKP